MGEIHFQEQDGTKNPCLFLDSIKTVAEKHGGSFKEIRPKENQRRFRIFVPDEKLQPIQADLKTKKLPQGEAWTDSQLACT